MDEITKKADSNLEDFMKEVESAERTTQKNDYFKLLEGDNRIVVLTNPKRYGEVFGIGIAFEGAEYSRYATNRFMCYVYDLADKKIKIAQFSYTVAQQLVSLAKGARTKFDSFPMPYVINLMTQNAGSKEIKVNTLAEEDFTVTEEINSELSKLDSIIDILDKKKQGQKKRIAENTDNIQEKIKNFISKKEAEYKERGEKMKKEQELPSVQIEDSVEYPDEEINLEDIPF